LHIPDTVGDAQSLAGLAAFCQRRITLAAKRFGLLSGTLDKGGGQDAVAACPQRRKNMRLFGSNEYALR